MKIDEKMLINEIKTLQKAAKLHAKYSISQYKKVLKALNALEEEKKLLEEKVRQRTQKLQSIYDEKVSVLKKLDKIAKYDQLTGLANRYLFFNELKLTIKESELTNKPFAVIFIDLDGFKLINDTYGHEIGDMLLQEIAGRIKKNLRKDDLVARIGGDEFTIILKNIDSEKILADIAKKLIKTINKPVYINDLKLFVGSSIGIYLNKISTTFEDILSKADIAMYEAKKAGKNTYVFFNDNMQKQLHKHTKLKHYIKNSSQNIFLNCFQPIIDSTSHTIKGCEILLRLKYNDKLISPNEFIDIIEEDIHLTNKITLLQIKEALKLINKTEDIFVSINLSAKSLTNFDFLNSLKNEIDSNMIRNRIYLEVTETSLSSNINTAAKILKELKKFGFLLSLDDFGTGYSSLAYIRDFPFDIIKIDKKFIENVHKCQKDFKLLQSIIQMAKILNMNIVLEGIENSFQTSILPKDENIKYQGYFFYKPMKKESFLKLIQ